MGMMNEGLSIADAMAIANGREGNGEGFGYGAGGTWIWVFFLFFLLAWGGNGFFGNRGDAALQGSLTRADLCQDMNFQQLENGVRGIQQGLCDGFYAMNTGLLNGFNGVQRDLCTGFNGINQNINQARFDAQQCCCETNRNIDAVRYENSRNTCDIVNAIREDGNATRALINANTMQDLRDKLADKDRDLMTAQFQISQQAQNQYLVNQIKPCAIPAYITCSPYESSLIGSRAYNGYYGGGCGCGCN